MRYLCCVILLTWSVCFGQTAQAPATTAQLKYLRFMLLNVASLDHSPDAVSAYEGSLVIQFGLSAAESAVIHTAGQSLKTVLAQLRQSTQALVAGKQTLAPADLASLASLNAQREQTIQTLVNQILNSVSAATATRLRAPGNVMAATMNASSAK